MTLIAIIWPKPHTYMCGISREVQNLAREESSYKQAYLDKYWTLHSKRTSWVQDIAVTSRY